MTLLFCCLEKNVLQHETVCSFSDFFYVNKQTMFTLSRCIGSPCYNIFGIANFHLTFASYKNIVRPETNKMNNTRDNTIVHHFFPCLLSF